MSKKRYDVLIVESNTILREKIAGILSREKETRVVSQIALFSDLKPAASELSPDLIIIGVSTLRKQFDNLRKLSDEWSLRFYLYGYEKSKELEIIARNCGAEGCFFLDEMDVALKEAFNKMALAKNISKKSPNEYYI